MGMNGSNRRRSSSSGRSASSRRRAPSPAHARRSSNDGTIHVVIPSAAVMRIRDSDARERAYFGEGRAVQKNILDAVERAGFDPDSVFAVKLALEEAMINAIKHGNKLDPAKKVHIDATINDREAKITIEDEGPGFNRATVPDPTAEENLTKCSGRGLLLMETYMTSVEYSNKGRKVHMLKRREPVKV
jgi:serine/threonine-protein kinase RsbW